jgi:hypothetical protein
MYLLIDVVPKASRAVVIRRFSLDEAPLGLFKFISDYLLYFEKINIHFWYFSILYQKKFELIYKDWSKLFVRFIVTMATKQPHFASSKKWKKLGFSWSIISCEQGGMWMMLVCIHSIYTCLKHIKNN